MSGRHARRPKVPFSVVAAVLVALAATVWIVVGRGRAAQPPSAASPQAPTPDVSALPSTTASPDRSPERRGMLLIHGAGDVSLDPTYLPVFRARGYAWAWSGLGGAFLHDDLSVVNLECPATTVAAPIPKQFDFRCDPTGLPVAARYGVDVVNQSNNHAYDQGPSGLLDSLSNIRRAGLTSIGAGPDESAATRPAMFELKGWRVAVLGFDEVLDPLDEVAGPGKPGTAAGHDFPEILRAIRAADARADLVVVMIHWGVELDTQPRLYQVEEGHRMVEAGADVIFGGHSHRLQPLEVYHGRPIFYSLGNFVWPRLSAEGATTGVARVLVRRDGSIAAKLIPATIVSDGHPVLG